MGLGVKGILGFDLLLARQQPAHHLLQRETAEQMCIREELTMERKQEEEKHQLRKIEGVH